MNAILEELDRLVCEYYEKYKREPNMVIMPRKIYECLIVLDEFSYRHLLTDDDDEKRRAYAIYTCMGLKIHVVRHGEMQVYEEEEKELL